VSSSIRTRPPWKRYSAPTPKPTSRSRHAYSIPSTSWDEMFEKFLRYQRQIHSPRPCSREMKLRRLFQLIFVIKCITYF